MDTTTPLRPTQHLRQLVQAYPPLGQQVDTMRAQRGTGLPQWPDWCFLPLAGTVAMLTQGARQPDLSGLGALIGIAGALSAWRVTQGVYRFDADIVQALWETPIEGELPRELLYHLPEWCCYVPLDPARELLPGLAPLHGFFVHLEWDANTHHPELRFVLDLEGGLLPLALHVQETGGIAGAFARTLDVSGENLARAGEVERATQMWQGSTDVASQIAPYLAPLVSLTLYLCSTAAEVQDATGQRARPERPQPTRTKKGERLFPPDRPTTWEVAYRLGAALRCAQHASRYPLGEGAGEAEAGSERARPRAHIRRAHFHTYWTGQGRTTPRVRWLHPILVGLPEEIVPTIPPVE